MYATSYKINNSYTTYVIHDYGEDTPRSYTYQRQVKQLEWKRGAKVKHYFYGDGKIKNITDSQIFVEFCNARAPKTLSNIQVMFKFKKVPSEIDSLRLCY